MTRADKRSRTSRQRLASPGAAGSGTTGRAATRQPGSSPICGTRHCKACRQACCSSLQLLFTMAVQASTVCTAMAWPCNTRPALHLQARQALMPLVGQLPSSQATLPPVEPVPTRLQVAEQVLCQKPRKGHSHPAGRTQRCQAKHSPLQILHAVQAMACQVCATVAKLCSTTTALHLQAQQPLAQVVNLLPGSQAAPP